MTKTMISKLNNDYAIVIPKALIDKYNFHEEDVLYISDNPQGDLYISKNTRKGFKGLCEEFFGCPIDEAPRLTDTEIDWGEPVGEEVW